jgi:glycosyltransferase involved in cell wall biosynthesis
MDQPLRSLYICYLSLDDPLVHTQVVAYLEGLAGCGHVVHLLTFDSELEPERRRAMAARLSRRGIEWHSRRYHKRPSLPATIYDTLVGAVTAVRIMRRHRLDAVHARNHVPAAMALIASRLRGCKLVFDLRGLMAEEYVDAGIWRRGGLPYRITDRIQRAAIERADGVVMLTEAVRRQLFGEGSWQRPIAVIPCCTDTASSNGRLTSRDIVRRELGIRDGPVMIYVGKFTGWYMEGEMVEFFAAAKRLQPHLTFVILTQADAEPIREELRSNSIAAEDYLIARAQPEEVPRFLAAADFGISFIRPSFSKISSSPTKIGEYLNAGLPVISTRGIGDVDPLLEQHGVGILVDDFSPPAYDAAAVAIRELAKDPHCRARCRAVARKHLSLSDVGVPRYDRLYREVARA